MTKEVKDVEAAAPAVDMIVYVDDVGHVSSGPLHHLVQQLVAAGHVFKMAWTGFGSGLLTILL